MPNSPSLTRQAEHYLEQEVLPPVLSPEAMLLDLGCGPVPNLDRLK